MLKAILLFLSALPKTILTAGSPPCPPRARRHTELLLTKRLPGMTTPGSRYLPHWPAEPLMSPDHFPPETRRLRRLAVLAQGLLGVVLLGCQVLPFGPRFVVDAEPDQEPPPPHVELCDARPAWQRKYWQGAVAPRDYELAITVVPLEKFTCSRATPLPPQFRTPDQQGWQGTREELRRAVFTGLRRVGLASAPTVMTLDSALVVVNKTRALQTVWEQTADARREALAHWRRGGDLRLTLGVSSGMGAPIGPVHSGAGVQWGSPQEIPPLPGEQPVSRAYGPVRGPPPDLGDYGPDVTCEIRARVAVQTPDKQVREVSLHLLTRSLPLEPPNFLSDEAVSSTFEAALRELTAVFVETWQGSPNASSEGSGAEPAASPSPETSLSQETPDLHPDDRSPETPSPENPAVGREG